ncbi:MAG: hypothetical protein ACSHW1_18785 [Yoonia sp.]|uniref:hypothetical protein n=1 Tax=Yoonia sp. TaxID=2212373 RepID=UPI003EF14552
MTYHIPHPFLNFEPSVRPASVAITLHLADPSDDVLVRHVRLLRDCVASAQKRWDFTVDAAAVLPNELHLLCAFRDADIGVNGAIMQIARAFDRHLPGARRSVWADAGEALEVPEELVFLRRDFIEGAPVRAGLVHDARDWPYSSAHLTTIQGHDFGAAVA